MSALFWLLITVLAYSYFGYPLLLSLISCFASRAERRHAVVTPRVTLIIPAYNEERILRQKLQNALALEYPEGQLEIVLVDDGSSDKTAEIANSFAAESLRVVRHATRCGKTSAINTAVKAARGGLLCLCDANVMFSRDAVTRLVARMADPAVGAVTGLVKLESKASDFGTGEDLYYKLERWIQSQEERLGSLICVDGGMYLIRADLLPTLPTDTILDDFAISMHVLQEGYQIRYEPEATGTETGAPTGGQEYGRRSRLAAGAVQALKRGTAPGWRRPLLSWQFVSHKLLRWMGPLLLMGLLVVSALTAEQGTYYASALAVQMIFYAAGVLAGLSPRFRHTAIGSVVYYFTLSQWAMGVGLAKGVLNRQSVAWVKADRTASSPVALDAITGKSLG